VRYEEIEHTADVGIRAFGSTMNELFANAAEGMFSLIADLSKVRTIGEVEVRTASEDPGELMVQWLTELLFLHETQRLLLREFDVTIEDGQLQARARGERIDKRRHELRLVVKAATYYRLRVDPDAGVAEIIFDI